MEEGERAEKGTFGIWEPPSLFGIPALGGGHQRRECELWRTQPLRDQDWGLGGRPRGRDVEGLLAWGWWDWGVQILHGIASCLGAWLRKMSFSLVFLLPVTTRSAVARTHSNTPPSIPSSSASPGHKEKLQVDLE